VLRALEDSRNPARGDGHRPPPIPRPHRSSSSSAGGAAWRRRLRRSRLPGGCRRGDRGARQAARRRRQRRGGEAELRRRRGEAGGAGHAQVRRAAVVAVPRRHEVRTSEGGCSGGIEIDPLPSSAFGLIWVLSAAPMQVEVERQVRGAPLGQHQPGRGPQAQGQAWYACVICIRITNCDPSSGSPARCGCFLAVMISVWVIMMVVLR
jgi:hypothetical protein